MTTNNEIDPDFDVSNTNPFEPETPMGRTLGSIRKMFKGLFAVFLSDGNRYLKIRDIADRAEVAEGLALKAPIDSPAFTGEPTAPTPDPEDASDRIVTSNFVQAKVVAIEEAMRNFVRDDDERLSDQRQPLSHAGTHYADGTDPIDPEGIGAVSASDFRLVNDRNPLPHAMSHWQDGDDPLPLGNATRAGVFTVDGNTIAAANGVLSLADGVAMPVAPENGVLYTGFGSIWKPLPTATHLHAGIVKPDGVTTFVSSDGTITAIGGGAEGNAAVAYIPDEETILSNANGVMSVNGEITSGMIPIARGGTGNATGLAASATKLATARTINGVPFNGTADIALPDGLTSKLTAAKTIYCAPANAGTGDGSSAANAMELQAALNSLRTVNMNGQAVTFTLAAGNYSKNYTHYWRFIYKPGYVILTCDEGVVFNAATGIAIVVYGSGGGQLLTGDNCGFYIRGNPTFANAASYAVAAYYGAGVQLDQGITFASTGGTAYLYAGPYSYIGVCGSSTTRRTVTIKNTGAHPTYFAAVSHHAYFYSRYTDYVITGTPAFTAFFFREGPNIIDWRNNTYTGAVGASTVRVLWTSWPQGTMASQSTMPGIRGPNENITPAYIDPSQTANQVLRTNTANSDPVWGKLNLATDVTGVLPAANGGSGSSTGAAPKPVTAAGVGQLVPVYNYGAVNNNPLPAGGTWAYFLYNAYYDDKSRGQALTGVVAGGTTIAVSGYYYGFAWRIA